MAVNMSIYAEGVRSVGYNPDHHRIAIHTRVVSGPAKTEGRDVVLTIEGTDLAFVLASLAQESPDLFLGIADAIAEADRKAAEATSPIDHMTWRRGPRSSGRDGLIRKAANRAIVADTAPRT